MKLTSLTILLLLVSCASQPLTRQEYLLEPPTQRLIEPEDAVLLSRVELPAYLDQTGIVLQTGQAEVHAGRQHSWAEPLENAISRYLQVAIGNQAASRVEVAPLVTGTATREVIVRIQRFHGSTSGRVDLVAEWIIRSEGTSQIHSYGYTEQQESDGYEALVAAHARLLDRLAAAIAASLTN